MKIENRSLSDVHPYERNPRQNDAAVDAVAESIRRFGFRQPIVVDEAGVIVAGHTRYRAAQQLGLAKVPVHVARDLTAEQIRAYRITDNKTAELAEWDLEQLAVELRELDEDWTKLGFEAAELDRLLAPTEIIEDEVPDPPADPVTKPGDLWVLGEHRLLCGDSTKAEDVARVMGGEKAALCLTDPPYGVAYQTKLSVEEAVARRRRTDGLEVVNDSLDADGTRALVKAALVLAVCRMRPGAAFYVCSPSGDMSDVIRGAVADAGLNYRQVIVWAKDVFVMGRQDYHWRHEDVIYGWKDGAGHYFVDDRTQDTVWEIPRPKRSEEHPTMKPVALFGRAMANSSRPGDLVADPFLGSGTTIIAAEQLNRRCFGIEISPAYCDVAVARWEKLTGRKACRS